MKDNFNNNEFMGILKVATDEITTAKAIDSNCKFRLETAVHKTSVRVYKIKKNKIVQITTVSKYGVEIEDMEK